MDVRFKFYGATRGVVNEATVGASLPEGATVRNALHWLRDRYGERFARLVLNQTGEPQSHVHLLLDDTEVKSEELDRPLCNGKAEPREICIYLLTGAMGGAPLAKGTQLEATEPSGRQVIEGREDLWIPSSCAMCYGFCAILVHRVNGMPVKIEGNPESPFGNGRLCPKGVAGIMTLYDPNRINKPLKRTNANKGIGVNPRWQEISWQEALDTLAEKLKKAMQEDPRKVFFQGTTTFSLTLISSMFPFMGAIGSPNFWAAGGGLHCGNGAHLLNGVMHASWSLVPDYEYCNYAIYFGASKGHAAGHAANANAQKAADARARGMKLVVVDPMSNFASGKATEWLPLRPGTDAASALSMVNVLLNELGIYDEEYLKKHTNTPYLVGTEGHYIRHKESGRPLVWDSQERRARQFNESDIKDVALEGNHEVDGLSAQPAFSLLKEHVKRYTPEKAAEVTTIPAVTIRRVAKEFGQAARIGSTLGSTAKCCPTVL